MADKKYDLVFRGGEVIDPAQNIHDTLDIGIKDGRIAALEKNIAVADSTKTVPAAGRLVVPGLIDMHCHFGAIDLGTFDADEMGLLSGVTALCEGGECGAGNFYGKRVFEFEPAETDVFCFLNLAMTGLAGYPEAEIQDEHDINPERTKTVAENNRDYVRGIKLRAIEPLAKSLGLKCVEIAKKVARDLRLPLVVHIGESRDRVPDDTIDTFTREMLRMLDRGDVLAHYLTWEAGGMILPDGTIYPELLEAQKRGVILDCCHGTGHFSFSLARLALQQELPPAVITTDLSPSSRRVVQSLLVTMSKMLNVGMPLEEIIRATTCTPAAVLGEEANRGSLKPGMPADISILELARGDFVFSDGKGKNILHGDRLLEPRLVVKNGTDMPCSSYYQVAPLF